MYHYYLHILVQHLSGEYSNCLQKLNVGTSAYLLQIQHNEHWSKTLVLSQVQTLNWNGKQFHLQHNNDHDIDKCIKNHELWQLVNVIQNKLYYYNFG